MQNIKEKSFKIIIVLLTSVMLLNIAVPTLVYAAYEDRDFAISRAKYIKENVISEDLRNQIDEESFAEYIHMKENSGNGVLAGKQANETDEHYQEKINNLAQNYINHYKPFKEKSKKTYDGKAYDKAETGSKFTDGYKEYLNQITGEFKQYLDETGTTEDYSKYLDESGKTADDQYQTAEEVDQKNEEEREYVKALLENDDEGYQDFWENLGEEISKNVFGTICSFATTIADAVVNTLQDLMLSCAPTAVTKRNNDAEGYIRKKLDARNDDSYIICFAKTGEAEYYIGQDIGWANPQSNKVTYEATSITEVPFIYYSPATILANKVPLFDVNFIGSKNNRIITPFLAEEDGTTYREGSDEDAKERIQATETNGIFKDRIGELEKEIDNARDDAKGDNLANPVSTLQGAISKWYITLRNISLVGLLIVLIYLGIRITISAAADEKAKYKAILKDWVMAVVLVVMLHVIMLFLITVTNIVINALDNASLDFVNDPYRWRYVNEQNKNINSIKYKKPKLDITTWIYINIHSISMVFNSIHMEICKKVNLYGFSNNDSTISRFNISNR